MLDEGRWTVLSELIRVVRRIREVEQQIWHLRSIRHRTQREQEELLLLRIEQTENRTSPLMLEISGH